MQNLTHKGDLGTFISSRTFHEKIEFTFQAQTPCVKFRKYFNFAGMSENMFQSFNMEVYENFFLVEFLVFQVARENY